MDKFLIRSDENLTPNLLWSYVSVTSKRPWGVKRAHNDADFAAGYYPTFRVANCPIWEPRGLRDLSWEMSEFTITSVTFDCRLAGNLSQHNTTLSRPLLKRVFSEDGIKSEKQESPFSLCVISSLTLKRKLKTQYHFTLQSCYLYTYCLLCN